MTPFEGLLFAAAAAVKASLVLAVAFLATRLMRGRAASERHLVWMLAAVCVLAVPILSLALPVWRIEVPAWLAEARTPGTVELAEHAFEHRADLAPVAAPAAPVLPAMAHGVGAARSRVAFQAVPGGRTERSALAAEAVQSLPHRGPAALMMAANGRAVELPPSGHSAGWRILASQLPGFVFGVWLMGAFAVALRVLLGHLAVHRLLRGARPLDDTDLVERVDALAREIGLGRPVQLLEMEDGAMPMTCGLVHGWLLLPSTARRWTASRREAVLRHELAHIRRRDGLTQFIAELGCMLYWFNPLMWWAARSICVEREHACDDAVLAAGSRPTDYAAELLAIAASLRTQRTAAVAAIAFARESQLRRRVAALLVPRARRDRASRHVVAGGWGVAAAAALALSVFAPAVQGAKSVAEQTPHPEVAGTHAVVAATPRAAEAAAARPRVAVAVEALPHAAIAAATASVPPISLAGMQEDCLSGGRNTRVNSNSNDERRTISWSGPNCAGDVLIEGDVRFDDAFTTVVGLSRGGLLRITTEEGRLERRVVIRPDGNGLSWEYAVNGNRQTFDREGQEWLTSTLTFLFRRMGFMARERAAAILARGGPEAVLDEVDLLRSDHVRAQYLTVLVDRGDLDSGQLRRVLDIAGESVSSDHYRSAILESVASRHTFDDALRDAYIRAVSAMGSDHYRHSAFSTVLESGRLTPAQQSAVLRESRRIESDHYRAALLEELAERYGTTPEIRAAYLDAAEGIESDHYKAGVLERVFASGRLDEQELARVLDTAASIDSDHYRAQVLARAAEYDLADAALQRSFVAAARGMGSDHYLESVLSPLVSRQGISAEALIAVLEAAEGIRSDHYRATLLLAIADRHRLEGAARVRFEELMEGMRSDTYRGRVATALLRNGR